MDAVETLQTTLPLLIIVDVDDTVDKEQMTYRVNGENIVVQTSCPRLMYLITTRTAVTSLP